MQTSKVTFEGSPPFALPVVQSAQADALDDTVVMTLYAVIDGQGPTPVPVMAQMTGIVALSLSQQLGRSGALAESRSRS